MSWKSERVFHNADTYYFSLLRDIKNAKSSVDLEVYIIDRGRFFDEFLIYLKEAISRGVKVRLLADGLGSWSFLKGALPSSIQVRVYHPLRRILFINRRNHKKVYMVDQSIAYLGSLNLTDRSFRWRETGIRLEGIELERLHFAFEKIWSKSKVVGPPQPKIAKGVKKLGSKMFYSKLTLLNHSFRLRRRAHKEWLDAIRRAQTRVWIVTPYFVPTLRQRAVLRGLIKRGVELKILIPNQSDVPWMMPLSYYLLRAFINDGVQVYEYLPSILHAKITLVDSKVFIGSSNWNHRSWLWDLECDVCLDSAPTILEIENQFRADLEVSRELLQPKSVMIRFYYIVVARLLWGVRKFL